MALPIWAGRYIGIAFKDHGRDRSGIDCWGLVRLVMAEQFGIALPSFIGEYKNTCESTAIAELVERESPKWTAVLTDDVQPGDVVILRLRGAPCHVGIALGDDRMLHVEAGIDSTIENYKNLRWKNRLHGFYRYRKSF